MTLLNKLAINLFITTSFLAYGMQETESDLAVAMETLNTDKSETDLRALYSQINLKFLCAYNIYNHIKNNPKSANCEKRKTKNTPKI